MDFAWETGFDVNQDPPDDTAENHPDKQAYYRGFPRDQRFTQSSPIHSPPSLATNLMATFLKSNTANIDFPLRRNWRTRLTRTMSLLSRCWHTTGQQWCASIIQEGVKEYPKPKGVKFTYGTAGVRTKGAILESVCYRIALISALRSKKLGGKTVGLMVTASHNPEEVSLADANTRIPSWVYRLLTHSPVTA